MADDIQKNAPVKEIFDELFSLLETLETQNVAIVEFLKEEGIATDEKFAPGSDVDADGQRHPAAWTRASTAGCIAALPSRPVPAGARADHPWLAPCFVTRGCRV